MLADTPGQKDRVFLILTGVWLFTALFLFGNPVILDYLHPPKSVILGGESPSNVLRYLGILAVLGLACVLGFSRLAKAGISSRFFVYDLFMPCLRRFAETRDP